MQVIHRTPVTNLGDELHHTSEWAGQAAAAAAAEVPKFSKPHTGSLVGNCEKGGCDHLRCSQHIRTAGWNACASCYLDATKRRAYLVAPALGSGRVYGGCT